MALRLEKLSATTWALMSDDTVVAEISGSTIRVNGALLLGTDTISPSAAELAAINGLTSTADELNLIDGSIAGTAVASKALALGANKNVDVLVVADGGLKLGSGAGTAIGATAAELNYNDITTLGTGAASKAVVLDADGNYTMPDGGYFKPSQAVLASAGTGQSTYAVIADENTIVTGADGTKGAALPAAVAGLRITVVNDSTTAVLPISPLNGGNDQINALTAGTGVLTMGAGRTAVFICTSGTKWYVEDQAAATATVTELNLIDGSIAGTAVASKAAVLGADKELDEVHAVALYTGAGAGTLIARTAAQINLLAQGVASGYKIARSAAPVALDGSNPTSVAHGLTTCVAVFVQLVGSAAPGTSTSVLTAVINAENIDVYAWKPNGAALTELVASTGTETFNWFAIGT